MTNNQLTAYYNLTAFGNWNFKQRNDKYVTLIKPMHHLFNCTTEKWDTYRYSELHLYSNKFQLIEGQLSFFDCELFEHLKFKRIEP